MEGGTLRVFRQCPEDRYEHGLRGLGAEFLCRHGTTASAATLAAIPYWEVCVAGPSRDPWTSPAYRRIREELCALGWRDGDTEYVSNTGAWECACVCKDDVKILLWYYYDPSLCLDLSATDPAAPPSQVFDAGVLGPPSQFIRIDCDDVKGDITPLYRNERVHMHSVAHERFYQLYLHHGIENVCVNPSSDAMEQEHAYVLYHAVFD